MRFTMNRKQLLFSTVLALALIATGCGVKPPLEGRADPYPAGQIHFANKDLKKMTAVGTPSANRDDAGNILYITVPLRAATNKELYVDYRVTFFDRTGQVLSQTN